MWKFINLVIGLIAVGGIFAYTEYKKKTEYTPVPAMVKTWKSYCYVTGKDHKDTGWRYRHRNLTCAERDKKLRYRSEYRKLYRVVYEFDYVSPVDGKRMRGKAEKDSLREPDYRKRGTEFTLHVHNASPDKYLP